jgi:hypothetical protein
LGALEVASENRMRSIAFAMFNAVLFHPSRALRFVAGLVVGSCDHRRIPGVENGYKNRRRVAVVSASLHAHPRGELHDAADGHGPDLRHDFGAVRAWRLETRYRFGEENPHGISPAVSLEYEDDSVEGDRRMTPRLVLNRDFESFNITLNLFREFRLAGPESSAWGYALGLRYGDEAERFRYGVELHQTFGREIRGVVIPQLFIKLFEGADMKVGYAQGLTRESESFVRVLFEFELGGKD